MNHSRFVSLLGACFLALSLSPRGARAQDFHSMRQSFATTGTLSWADQSQNIGRVRVELDEDGAARLKFDNEARPWNWGWREGDWKDWNNNLELDGLWVRDERGVSVDLRRGFGGQNIVGAARITMEDGTSHPSALSLSGRIVRHPWDTLDLTGKFTFGAWNGGGNVGGGGNIGGANRLDELSTIKRGTGQFSDGDQTSDLSRANVELSRDGTAKISLTGDRDYSFEGRWRQTSATRIELRLDTFAAQNGPQFDAPRAQRDADSLGGGEIRLNGTRITSIRLSGTRGDRDFDAQFAPQTGNGNGGGNWNGNLPAPNPVPERNNGGNWGNWNLPAPAPETNTGDNGWTGNEIDANAVDGNAMQAPVSEPQEPAQERPKPRPRPRKPTAPPVEETPPAIPDPIQASWQGNATLKRSDGNENFSSASVSLEPTGLGKLRVGDHTLFGRWRQTGANAYSMKLENAASHCTANIKLNRGKIVSLQITGQVDNAQTNLNLGE